MARKFDDEKKYSPFPFSPLNIHHTIPIGIPVSHLVKFLETIELTLKSFHICIRSSVDALTRRTVILPPSRCLEADQAEGTVRAKKKIRNYKESKEIRSAKESVVRTYERTNEAPSQRATNDSHFATPTQRWLDVRTDINYETPTFRFLLHLRQTLLLYTSSLLFLFTPSSSTASSSSSLFAVLSLSFCSALSPHPPIPVLTSTTTL